MAQQFIPTSGGNIYPDENTDYDQSESFRKVALNRDTLDAALAEDSTAKADQAKADAISDAATEYGGLPQRVTNVEAKNTEQDGRMGGLDLLAASLAAKTVAINAPVGFDADSVTGQAVHMVDALDVALGMPGPGSWLLWTYPQDGALQQVALLYNVATPEMHARVKSGTAWWPWHRLDADKWVDRLVAIEAKDAAQDTALANLAAKDSALDQRIDALKTSHISLDTDGVPYFDPGSMAVQVLQDDDGVPYFMQALAA